MVKDLNATVERWQRKVGVAEQDYLQGVQNPTKDWQQEALRAEQSYNQGVLAAMDQRSWATGVSQVPTQEWQRKTLEKSPRWRQGVGVATQDYADAMNVVLRNVEGSVADMERAVGPRGPRGSEQNINRSATFQRGMHQRTLATSGAPVTRGALAQAPAPVAFQPTAPAPRVQEPISVDQFGRPVTTFSPPPPAGNPHPAIPEQQPGRLYTPRSF